MMATDYQDRFEEHQGRTLYSLLAPDEQKFVRSLAFDYRFTFQELHQLTTHCRDLAMWGESSLESWWRGQESELTLSGRLRKKELFHRLRDHLQRLQQEPKRYPSEGTPPPDRRPYSIEVKSSDRQIFGMCPVYSEDTVCCGLRTLDAVARCSMGCSYCTIQTFYGENVVVEADLESRLRELEPQLDPDRFYHIGTGQSSDSLLWGNRNGLLDALFGFARRHPNIVLELKTKSSNVSHLLRNPVPPNVVCSWSLNTPTIITNEEHHTASLEERLTAAHQVAARGVAVAFHLHPLIHYQGWETEYTDLARQVQKRFSPDQVLFLSFGTVTFIKPVLKEIRRRGARTRITQMAMEPDPKGKLTYPLAIKEALYSHLHGAFKPWQNRVFIYLCMEPAPVWQAGLGFCHTSSAAFEEAFAQHLKHRISAP